MDETIKRRCGTELAVLLEEECGFRNWIWFPRMALQELIDWWRDQERVARFADERDSPYLLPGEIFFAESEEVMDFWFDSFKDPRFCKAWINSEDDSYLITSTREFVVDRAFPRDRIPATLARFSQYLS